MKKRIRYVNGMPVEIPALDEVGKQERERLNMLALKEYESTGTLSSEKLQEANAQFLEKAKEHLIQDEQGTDEKG